jgi:hypothetical protein
MTVRSLRSDTRLSVPGADSAACRRGRHLAEDQDPPPALDAFISSIGNLLDRVSPVIVNGPARLPSE